MVSTGPLDPQYDRNQAEEKLRLLRAARKHTKDKAEAKRLDVEIADWEKALQLADQRIRAQSRASAGDC